MRNDETREHMQVLFSAPSPPEIRRSVEKRLAKGGARLLENPGGRGVVAQEDLAHMLVEADGLIIGPGRVDREMLTRAGRLKAISKHGIGVEGIDLSAATELRIPVSNTPGSNAISVAELCFGLILTSIRHLHVLVASSQPRPFADSVEWRVGRELNGRRLGIVGLGSVGREIAIRGRALGMKVATLASENNRERARQLDVTRLELGALAESSDVLAISCPLTPETRDLIGWDELVAMPRDGIVVNVARGGIVNEEALLRAVREEVIAGAALDVVDQEPLNVDDPLLADPRIIVTPHVGGATSEALRRTALLATENLLRMFAGEQVDSQLNKGVGGNPGTSRAIRST